MSTGERSRADAATGNQHRRPGRPRSEASRRAILDAVSELVATTTPASLRIADIAQRAGVGKATIYRWWDSRAELLLEALRESTVSTLAVPDDATTEQALALQLSALQALLADPQLGGLLIALTVEAQDNAETAADLRRIWLSPRRQSAADLLRRGIERGELRGDLDIEIAVDQLFAPLYHRAIYRYAEADDNDAARLVHAFLHGAAAQRSVALGD
ncbi:MAG: TetR/AcrR family transcriptional regulator [Acidipropionibacterium sp.]|jgi:AcrR family transcriptional regulator|nr:TetR/AcrR family transcriptional regulator [Acidipropionibacterium sp.]